MIFEKSRSLTDEKELRSTMHGNKKKRKKKVLFVDDKETWLVQAELFLTRKNKNLEVDTVNSGKKALKKIRNDSYDVLISDFEMPGVNGLELLMQLRSQGNEIPFILLTRKKLKNVLDKALAHGADYVIQKSDSPDVQYRLLTHLISKEVNRKRDTESTTEDEIQKSSRKKRREETAESQIPDQVIKTLEDHFNWIQQLLRPIKIAKNELKKKRKLTKSQLTRKLSEKLDLSNNNAKGLSQYILSITMENNELLKKDAQNRRRIIDAK